jgi:hypothetical protein
LFAAFKKDVDAHDIEATPSFGRLCAGMTMERTTQINWKEL